MNTYFEAHKKELLSFNTDRVDVIGDIGEERVNTDIARYLSSLEKNTNYNKSDVQRLEDWRHPNNATHPFHSKIADFCATMQVRHVLDAGAGAGVVAKAVHAKHPSAHLTCVEQSPIHFRQMEENFSTRFDVVGAPIQVHARRFNQSIHDLSNFSDGEFDMVYTCTVMMHIPFIPAIAILCELARVTSKFILHVENVRACTAIGDMQEHRANTLSIDYKKVYESMGFTTVIHSVDAFPDNVGHFYVVYLGKK